MVRHNAISPLTRVLRECGPVSFGINHNFETLRVNGPQITQITQIEEQRSQFWCHNFQSLNIVDGPVDYQSVKAKVILKKNLCNLCNLWAINQAPKNTKAITTNCPVWVQGIFG
jgi:hypothetical protein